MQHNTVLLTALVQTPGMQRCRGLCCAPQPSRLFLVPLTNLPALALCLLQWEAQKFG